MEKDDPKLQEAVKICQNILKTVRNKIDYPTTVSLNNFLRAASFGSSRKKLTTKDLDKIINIATRIK
jgi:hypothetical protein